MNRRFRRPVQAPTSSLCAPPTCGVGLLTFPDVRVSAPGPAPAPVIDVLHNAPRPGTLAVGPASPGGGAPVPGGTCVKRIVITPLPSGGSARTYEYGTWNCVPDYTSGGVGPGGARPKLRAIICNCI